MKHTQTTVKTQGGYTTLAIVSGVSLLLISMMAFTLMNNIRSLDTQAQAQIKQDYTQKEDAILNALIHIVPNKAIGAMKRGSSDNEDDFTWDQIFTEAITMANGRQSIDATLIESLELENAISGNSGDADFTDIRDFVVAATPTWDDSSNSVNPGHFFEFQNHLDSYPAIASRLPAPMRIYFFADYYREKRFPIITYDKHYFSSYQKGLALSATDYPKFNLLQYPNVNFGYKRPGELFVSRRNWWVFSLIFGKNDEERTGIPSVKKNYVLSIYETPSQLPLSSAASMKVGQFDDGTDWSNVTLDGGINAKSVETNGTVALAQGAISARESVTLNGTTTVAGRTVESGFDALGARENRALDSQSDFYDASTGGNTGKVAFIPINEGQRFLFRGNDGESSERISPTGWFEYSRGAMQAKMRIQVREMFSEDEQIPIQVRFFYEDTDGTNRGITYTRGGNWPTEFEPGGDAFPFQTGPLENGREALVINLDRFPSFLDSINNAADVTVNNSLYIDARFNHDTVRVPEIPALDDDLVVTLRGGEDLSSFTSGLSFVSRFRTYIGDSLNTVSLPVPANSGIPSGAEYYPPLSLFAPEKRFGESSEVSRPVQLQGQLSSLMTRNNDVFNPLDLVGGDESSVSNANLNAELTSLRSPADLPPIHLMNWLVTVEEIH